MKSVSFSEVLSLPSPLHFAEQRYIIKLQQHKQRGACETGWEEGLLPSTHTPDLDNANVGKPVWQRNGKGVTKSR